MHTPPVPSYSIARPPAVYVGPSALKRLPGLIQASAAQSVALIADEALQRSGYLQRVTEVLAALNCRTHVLPSGEPTLESVNEAVRFARALPEPLVLGVGGGSALDTAKQVAAVLSGDAPLEHYLLSAHRFTGRRPLIALPTTAGTGAEATRVCVVSDEQGRKLWTWGTELLPDAVLLDPSATLSVPREVTVATGLDALVHAVEAATSSRRNSLSDAAALQAVRLLRAHLPLALEDPQDLAGRQHLQEAAYLAGLAFDQSALGIAHNIGHALGTCHHLPHGVAVALALDASLEWNLEGAPEVYASVAGAFGTTARELPGAMRAFMTQLGFAGVVARLPSVEIDQGALADAMNAPENRSLFETNARSVAQDAHGELARRTHESWLRWWGA